MTSASSIVGGSIGFVRDNIPVIAVWTLAYMVGGILMSVVSQPLVQVQLTVSPGSPPVLPPGFFLSFAAMYVVMIVMFVALFAAVFRAVLQPERSQAAYLRLGMDELRLCGLLLLFGLSGLVVTIVITLVLGFLIGFVALLLGAGQATGVLLVVLIYCLILIISIWLMVRLSTAAPLTILRGKIVIREAWRLTKGKFWPLFGGYLTIVLPVCVAFAIFFAIVMGSYYTTLLHSVGDPLATQAALRSEMEKVAIGQPMWFVMLIVGGIFGGVAVALQGAMTAIATRELLAEAPL